MSTSSSLVFVDLGEPTQRSRWGSFAASYAVQIIAMAALLVYGIVAPRIDPAPTRHIDWVAPDLDKAPAKVAQAKPVRQVVRPQLVF